MSTLATLTASPLAPALLILGSVTLTLLTVQLLDSLYKYFLRPGKNLRKCGEWAVITGATDGERLHVEELARQERSVFGRIVKLLLEDIQVLQGI